MNKFLMILMTMVLAGCGLDSPQEKKSPGKDAKPEASAATTTPEAVKPQESDVQEDKDVNREEKFKPLLVLPAPTEPVVMTFAHRIANGEFDGPLGVNKLRNEAAIDDEVKHALYDTDDRGRVPLHYAKDRMLIEFLWKIEYGVQKIPAYRVPDKRHQTPLHVFADEGFVDGVNVYLRKFCRQAYNGWSFAWDNVIGNQVNATDSENRTPLHLAVIAGQKEVVKQMMTCLSVNLSPLDSYGRAPMHYAAEIEDFTMGFAIVYAALQRNEDLHLTHPDKKGESAIDLARKFKNAEALAVLEAAALGHKLPRSN